MIPLLCLVMMTGNLNEWMKIEEKVSGCSADQIMSVESAVWWPVGTLGHNLKLQILKWMGLNIEAMKKDKDTLMLKEQNDK